MDERPSELHDELHDKLRPHLDGRRPWHIVESYRLFGDEDAVCRPVFQDWLEEVPTPLVELALVETLVVAWATVPMPRGRMFVERARRWLGRWLEGQQSIRIQPSQFRAVTGLDPLPVVRAVERARLARSRRPAVPHVTPSPESFGFGATGD